MASGGHGSISVTANVAPEALAEATRLAHAGDIAAAKAIDAKLAGLHDKLFVQSNPIPVKYAMLVMGKIEAGIRLPLTPLEPAFHSVIKTALKAAELSYE